MKYSVMEAAERAESWNADDNLARKDRRRKEIQRKQQDKSNRGKKTVSQKRRRMIEDSKRFEQMLYETY